MLLIVNRLGVPSVDMITTEVCKAPSYKPDQDLSVTQGKNGLVVSQGQGDATLNLQVPQAKHGDFEKVAIQIAQLQQTRQVAMQADPRERKGPTV